VTSRITSAVIAAAGSASRMWPASKVVPKELFPLGRIPALVYVIREIAEAGIDDIVVVVRDDNELAVQNLLDDSVAPPSSIRGTAVVEDFVLLLNKCHFRFVRQKGPYGNGTPLLNGFELLSGESCIYAFADDIILGDNATSGLLETNRATGSVVLSAQQVPMTEISKFGIVECSRRSPDSRSLYVQALIEKPAPGQTLSRLASIGRYVVTRGLVETLANTEIGRGGELWLTDAFVQWIRDGNDIAVFPLAESEWFTVGTPEGFRAALLAAMRLEEMRDRPVAVPFPA
jgi:UTP--glucose-1-phosphate uridylyltransferase